MSAPEIEALASPPTSTPWVPLWPVGGVSMGELGYAEVIGDLTIPVVAEASAATVVTAPAITVDGATPIVIAFDAHLVATGAANAYNLFTLWDGSTDLGIIAQHMGAGATLLTPISSTCRFTPSAGTHTYSIRAHATGSAGVIYGVVGGGPGNRLPTSIRITLAAPISNAPAGALLPVQYGTSLPGSPVDGQEAILVDSLTNSTYQWRFRFNAGSSSAYKWEFVGGSPLLRSAAGDLNQSLPAGTWVDMVNTPTFTIPRAGDYEVTITLGVYNWNAVSAGYGMYCRVNIGGATTMGATVVNPDGTKQAAATVTRTNRLDGLSAGAAGKLQMMTDATVPTGFDNPIVIVRPIRVS